WSDVRDNNSNKDGLAVKQFLVVKLASPIFDAADCRLAQRTALAVCKIEAPLTGLGIVQTQAQSFDVTRRAIGHEFHQIGATIPNLPDNGSTVIFDPGVGTSQGAQEPP